jgi:Cytochrome c biogenesis factor
MSLPMIVALLFLMGVGPALPWRSASTAEIREKLLPPIAGAVVLLVAAILFGARGIYPLLAFTFIGYSATANLREYWIGIQARRAAHGENPATALARLVGGNRHRYGGYLAHIGILLVAIGVTASLTFRREREATLKPGESMSVAGKTVRLREVWGREEPQRSVVGATMDVMDKGRVTATLHPRMNFYPTSTAPVVTPDVKSSIGGDLYLNLMAFEPRGATATIKMIVEPLTPWIWFGGGIVVLGALVCVSPERRHRARSVEARVIAPVPAEVGA